MNVFNGFLLAAHLDALFDRHLMTFDEAGFAVFAPSIGGETRTRLGLCGSVRLRWLLQALKMEGPVTVFKPKHERFYHVFFRHAGKQINRSTGEASYATAKEKAAQIWAEVVTRPQRQAEMEDLVTVTAELRELRSMLKAGVLPTGASLTAMPVPAARKKSLRTACDEYPRGRGTSLGGLRPKCTVIDSDGMLTIGKFPSVQDERAVTKGEGLAMTLAEAAGINVAKSGELPIQDRAALSSKTSDIRSCIFAANSLAAVVTTE